MHYGLNIPVYDGFGDEHGIERGAAQELISHHKQVQTVRLKH